MEEKEKMPEFKAKIEVPLWISKTKEGKKFLYGKLFGMPIRFFKNEPPKKEKKNEEEFL